MTGWFHTEPHMYRTLSWPLNSLVQMLTWGLWHWCLYWVQECAVGCLVSNCTAMLVWRSGNAGNQTLNSVFCRYCCCIRLYSSAIISCHCPMCQRSIVIKIKPEVTMRSLTPRKKKPIIIKWWICDIDHWQTGQKEMSETWSTLLHWPKVYMVKFVLVCRI